MKMELLEDLYLSELADVYDAERQLLAMLPKMAQMAQDPELRKAFELHAKETEGQIKRLEQIFKNHGGKQEQKRCLGMAGLIAEMQEMQKEELDPELMDAAIIAGAQKTEHYEICAYGTCATYAKLLELEPDLKLLLQTLAEEKATDGKLTMLAKAFVNEQAASGEIPSEEAESDREEGGESMEANRVSKSKNSSAGRTHKAQASEPRSKRMQKESRGKDDSDDDSKTTTDLDEIRQWAESRGGKPAFVTGTGTEDDPGLLRIDFPEYGNEGQLEPTSWEDWYEKFQEKDLLFLYQDKTSDGKTSRFFKLIRNTAKKK